MRGLGKRSNLFRRKLIDLKCGPGAAVLPPNVSRIHLDFAHLLRGGHMGPRKFWKENLPRLKYHNPTVPMIINRHRNNDQPPVMTIYIRDADTDAASTTPVDPKVQPGSSQKGLSPAQTPAEGERVVHVDMKNKHSSVILEHLLAETRAVPIRPTEEEAAEIEYVQTMKKNAVVDRARIQMLRDEKKREADMLKRARALGGSTED